MASNILKGRQLPISSTKTLDSREYLYLMPPLCISNSDYRKLNSSLTSFASPISVNETHQGFMLGVVHLRAGPLHLPFSLPGIPRLDVPGRAGCHCGEVALPEQRRYLGARPPLCVASFPGPSLPAACPAGPPPPPGTLGAPRGLRPAHGPSGYLCSKCLEERGLCQGSAQLAEQVSKVNTHNCRHQVCAAGLACEIPSRGSAGDDVKVKKC